MIGFLALLGGIARAVVGAGWVSRGIAYPIASAICAFAGLGLTWWAIPFAIIPAVTFWVGYTKWEDRWFMAVRYGAATTLLGSIYFAMTGNWTGLLWGAASMASGIFYNDLQKHTTWISKLSSKLDSSRVAEFVAGSIVIGGVSLLGG